MIYHILKSYFVILLAIGIGAMSIFTIGLYFILRKPKSCQQDKEIPNDRASISQKVVMPGYTKDTAKNGRSCLKNVIFETASTITASDISAIAGDDLLATQLDLARAYIEAGRKQLAKKILEDVVKQGSDAQQSEARNLLGLI